MSGIRGIEMYPDTFAVKQGLQIVAETCVADPVREPETHRAAVFLCSLVHVSKLTNWVIQGEAGWDCWTVREYMRKARSAGILGQQVQQSSDPMDRFPDDWMHREMGNLALAFDAMVVAGRLRRTKDGRYYLPEQEGKLRREGKLGKE